VAASESMVLPVVMSVAMAHLAAMVRMGEVTMALETVPAMGEDAAATMDATVAVVAAWRSDREATEVAAVKVAKQVALLATVVATSVVYVAAMAMTVASTGTEVAVAEMAEADRMEAVVEAVGWRVMEGRWAAMMAMEMAGTSVASRASAATAATAGDAAATAAAMAVVVVYD